MLNTKTLKKLIIITTICAVPVVLIAVKSNKSIINDKVFLPGLLTHREEISRIILQNHDNTLTLQKNNGEWQLAERNNYPVLGDKVDDLLYSLGDLRILEAKTSKPELHQQLDVNDINEANSKAILITVLNNKNEQLTQLYIGKREGLRVGEEYQEHIFIRKAGEEQAWLVQGILPLSSDFRDWLEQPLLGIIEADAVRCVEIIRPQASKIKIFKTQAEQEDFILEASASKPGMTLDIDTVNSLPFEVAELEFDDVLPSHSVAIDWDKSITANLETFQDVNVLLKVVKHDGKVFAKVQANASPNSSDELLNKVDAYNKNHKDWVFALPAEFYYVITAAKADFLKPKA